MNINPTKFMAVNITTALLVTLILEIILYVYPDHPQYLRIRIISLCTNIYGFIVHCVYFNKFHWEGIKNTIKNSLGYGKKKET